MNTTFILTESIFSTQTVSLHSPHYKYGSTLLRVNPPPNICVGQPEPGTQRSLNKAWVARVQLLCKKYIKTTTGDPSNQNQRSTQKKQNFPYMFNARFGSEYYVCSPVLVGGSASRSRARTATRGDGGDSNGCTRVHQQTKSSPSGKSRTSPLLPPPWLLVHRKR